MLKSKKKSLYKSFREEICQIAINASARYEILWHSLAPPQYKNPILSVSILLKDINEGSTKLQNLLTKKVKLSNFVVFERKEKNIGKIK